MSPSKTPSSQSRKSLTSSLPAYILAGGESRRFGQDKTLISWDGQPLVVRTVHIAQEVASVVKIVARHSEKFEFVGVPVLLDVVERVGPLGGLLTALEDCPVERCFVLACDLPYLTAAWLLKLAEVRSDTPIVFSHSTKGSEPLCAIYAKRTLPHWWARYRAGKRSLWDGILDLAGVPVEPPPELESRLPFFNLNWPDSGGAVGR